MSKIEKLKQCTMNRKDNIEWDWPQAVSMYGLLRLWENTGDFEAKNYLIRWCEENIKLRPQKHAVNGTAPMIILSSLYRENRDEKYREVCDEYIDWIFHQAPKLRCGALEHTVLQERYFPHEAWIDTTFMVCIFLTTMYEITGKEECAKEALKQLKLHHRILKDKETGMCCHGYHEDRNDNLAGAIWGRGNGWLAVASAEVLSRLKDFNEDYHYVKAMFYEQMSTAVQYQNENGMWRTLINKEDSYFESSGTACLTYALLYGIKNKLLPDSLLPFAQKGYQAIYDRVDDQGMLTESSNGLGCKDDIQLYYDCGVGNLTPWGQGIALALLSYVKKNNPFD